MNREEVIKWIDTLSIYLSICDNQSLKDSLSSDIEKTIKALDMAVEALENQQEVADATKWIPCSERLPEMYDKKLLGDYDNSKEVIVTIQYRGNLYVSERSVIYCSDGVWRYTGDNDVVHEIEDIKVVAWMPLPEPYKGENEVI